MSRDFWRGMISMATIAAFGLNVEPGTQSRAVLVLLVALAASTVGLAVSYRVEKHR